MDLAFKCAQRNHESPRVNNITCTHTTHTRAHKHKYIHLYLYLYNLFKGPDRQL